mgnify:CR=1 FL=1
MAIGLGDVHGLDRMARRGLVGEHHFLQLRAQAAPDDRKLARAQHRLVDVELVGVDRALHHHLAQAPGRGDEHDVAEARFGVHGEHARRSQPRSLRAMRCTPADSATAACS